MTSAIRRIFSFCGICTALVWLTAASPVEAKITIALSPAYAQVVADKNMQFTAEVSGTNDTRVTWQVNNADGGDAKSGKISHTGTYMAPAKLPEPALVTIRAVSVADPSASATAAVTLLRQTVHGATYYVATNGDDGDNGSKDAPWATIQHAADSVKAGDTVLVRQGIYREHVRIHNSGSADSGFISFENYPGETPVLDGKGLDIPQGQWGLFTVDNAGYVVLSGFELRNYTTDSIRQVPIGIFVFGAGKELQIVNNRIHDIATTAKTTPKQCGSNAFGLTVYGTKAPAAIEDIAIAGNEIFDTKTGCSETLSLDGNVKDFLVANNFIHDADNIAIGAIGFEKVSPDPRYDQARDGIVGGNVIDTVSSFGNPDYGRQYAADGIYVDGGTDIVIEQNLIHAVDLGIELASEHKNHTSSDVIVRNNIVYGGNSAGISIGGYGPNRGGTDRCTIVNNTLYANDTKKTGSGEFQIQFNATRNIFENNIVYAGPQNLFVNDFTKSTDEPAVLDYNLYFSMEGEKSGQWVWQKRRYKGYDAYRNATGLDAHSPDFSDPQFESVSPPDFRTMKSSPARDAGIVLGDSVTGRVDFPGGKRVFKNLIDLGAYER